VSEMTLEEALSMVDGGPHHIGEWAQAATILAAEVRRLQAENARLRPEAGHVIDENGVKRRVLGTLPLTADGCVVIDQPVYHPTFGQMYVWKDGKGTWRAKGWLSDYKQAAPLTDCYASHDAAKEARNGEGDK